MKSKSPVLRRWGIKSRTSLLDSRKVGIIIAWVTSYNILLGKGKLKLFSAVPGFIIYCSVGFSDPRNIVICFSSEMF